jgi:hypothetical protein
MHRRRRRRKPLANRKDVTAPASRKPARTHLTRSDLDDWCSEFLGSGPAVVLVPQRSARTIAAFAIFDEDFGNLRVTHRLAALIR